MSDCPFCNYLGPSVVRRRWSDAYVIEPLNPVTDGHLLVIPFQHIATADENPYVASRAFARAAELVEFVGDCNLIQSNGVAATQTVRHLHIHVVPRSRGDGLLLPWSSPAASAVSGSAVSREQTT